MTRIPGTSHRWVSHFSVFLDFHLKLFTSHMQFPLSQDSTFKNFRDKLPNHHLTLSLYLELWKKQPKIPQEWDDEGLSTDFNGISNVHFLPDMEIRRKSQERDWLAAGAAGKSSILATSIQQFRFPNSQLERETPVLLLPVLFPHSHTSSSSH